MMVEKEEWSGRPHGAGDLRRTPRRLFSGCDCGKAPASIQAVNRTYSEAARWPRGSRRTFHVVHVSRHRIPFNVSMLLQNSMLCRKRLASYSFKSDDLAIESEPITGTSSVRSLARSW